MFFLTWDEHFKRFNISQENLTMLCERYKIIFNYVKLSTPHKFYLWTWQRWQVKGWIFNQVLFPLVLPGLKSYTACTVSPQSAYYRGKNRGQDRTPKSKCVLKNEAEYLWWWRIPHRVEGGNDLHVWLVDSSSLIADLTLVRVEVNLLHQQEHLVFLLARARAL